jgi:hypothetical protein
MQRGIGVLPRIHVVAMHSAWFGAHSTNFYGEVAQ